jgi:hypothetical protein
MNIVKVTHVKGCVEDLEIGEGPVQQIRNGKVITLTKLGAASIPWSVDPITGASISIRTRMEGLEVALVNGIVDVDAKVNAAALSEAAAATSQNAAALSEKNAALSEAAAATSQNAAALSEKNAALSEAAAAASQNAAALSEKNAALSEKNAALSEAAAATNYAKINALAYTFSTAAGFDAISYDFGSILDQTTYFNRDFGAL